ncbi:thioesterase-like superfamily-domain-containing protein [Hypoxylon sp. FL1284]|nr:thioesterase-like superfamily-domain-containing protein [Hypoxylon sp. FL1284]
MIAPSFAVATAVRAVDSHTYEANFDSQWCVGSVPHGGVVTSVFLRVAATHFRTTLAAQNQPHTISLHVEFLRRTQEGAATLAVRHVKLGRQTSTIHLSLLQEGREEVVGYLTHSNLDAEDGLSLTTRWALQPLPPPPPTNFAALLTRNDDPSWIEQTDKPFPKFRKVSHRVRTFLPREGHVMPGVIDQWLRLDSGEHFTNESIGFVSDNFPSVVDSLWPQQKEKAPPLWYPTVALNLDIKKTLPPGGVEWLFLRVRPKCINNGRMDLEVVVFDAAGEIVALSQHVVLIVGAERNMAARRSGQTKI